MKEFPPELIVLIFQYVEHPISLILLNRNFHELLTEPIAKSTWALNNFGRAHVLFFAISLGKTFITVDVVKSLLALKVNFSRYFIQRLLLQYGQCDEELIQLKLQDDNNNSNNDNNNNSQELNQAGFEAFRPSIKTPWASDIPFDVFITLLNEAEARFGPNLPLKGNDIEKFHFLTSGQLPINQALEEIRDLIVKQKFIPFPPRPKIPYNVTHDYSRQMQIINREEFPAKDGYENNKHLHIIARAILLENSLVNMWKEIGYHDICRDVNDLVIQGCILRLFPSSRYVPWDPESTKRDIVNEWNNLIEIGFKLTESSMVNILCFCEDRLDVIGDSILLEAFHKVRQEPKPVIIQKCLFEITRVDREMDKNLKVLDFLVNDKKGHELEFTLLKTIAYHLFGTKTKKILDVLEISEMQSTSNVENYVSISGQARIPKEKYDPLAFTSHNHSDEDSSDNSRSSILYGSRPFDNNNNNNNNNNYFAESLKSWQRSLLHGDYKKIKNYDIENPINGVRTLTLRSSLYRWILRKFDPNSIVTRLCFHDIILSRIWIDMEKQRNPERDITTIVRGCAIDEIILIYEDFCKKHVPFEIIHMHLLKKSSKDSTLKPLFEEILTRALERYYDQGKFYDMNYIRWSKELKNEYNSILGATSVSSPTELFKKYFINTYEKLLFWLVS